MRGGQLILNADKSHSRRTRGEAMLKMQEPGSLQ